MGETDRRKIELASPPVEGHGGCDAQEALLRIHANCAVEREVLVRRNNQGLLSLDSGDIKY